LKEKTFLLYTLCFVLACCFSIPAQEMAGEEITTATIPTLFPAERGLKWRYLRNSREGQSHYTTNFLGVFSKEDKQYQILGNPYGVSYYTITPEALSLEGIAPADDLKKVDFYKNESLVRLKAPLRSGHRWSGRTRTVKDKEAILTVYSTEIIGWGVVDVPAGRFDTVITSSTLNTLFFKKETGFGKGVLSYEMVWYARDVGIVRRLNFLIYGERQSVPLRDDQLEEFIREEKKKVNP